MSTPWLPFTERRAAQAVDRADTAEQTTEANLTFAVASKDGQERRCLLDRTSDYGPQCTEDTGGFSLETSFTHSWQEACEGDTIVTGYTFEVGNAAGALGGGDIFPGLRAAGLPLRLR